ncbi:Protein PTST-like 2, chloroplastic [Vitis vinifera]|uniref:Protein PTST-like 2, chloroplastic n=1 Tax=Vitis vinifera TaxID=29760 RepID=A0A438HDC3_VITVI|nr:Protein PTST-like 2, chloroplastic [Vitis vinifera]
MLSFTVPSCRFLVSRDLNLFPTFPSLVFLIDPGKVRQRKQFRRLRLAGTRGIGSLARGVVRRCQEWESEGDWGLEEEILEFMKKSERPEAFPSRKELVDGGRMDLVEAIVEKGGWLSLGWDLDAEEGVLDDDDDGRHVTDWDLIMRKANDGDLVCGDGGGEANDLEVDEIRVSGLLEADSSDLDSASSSGRSLEVAAEDNTGIEGILKGLETHRNVTFGVGMREKGNGSILINNNGDDWHSGNSTNAGSSGLGKISRQTSSIHNKGIIKDSGGKYTQMRSFSDLDGLGNSLKSEMWRTWGVYRAGFSVMDVEAAGIACKEARMEEVIDISKDEILAISEGHDISKELNSHGKEVNHSEIQSRLQDMELELSSILRALKSTSDGIVPLGNTSSSDDLQKLSDALEFQENEIMNSQDILRSLRAKLAVVEGKMALAIIDAQKLVEEKQKRIGDAHSTLQLLRSSCIVWPNSASEVLLAGSFDGWTTQVWLNL